MQSFKASRYFVVWFSNDGDRLKTRRTLESHIQTALNDPRGKLEVREDGPHWLGKSPFHFSYSHSENQALLVYSETTELGVDIEPKARKTQQDPMKIAERFFHENEIKTLKSFAENSELQTRHFLELWTQKEAYGKLTRLGLKDSIHLEVASLSHVTFESLESPDSDFIATIATYRSK